MRFVLEEGRNRQIRRMVAAAGGKVVHLHRTEVCGIGLSGLRGEGDWCELNWGERELIAAAIREASEVPVGVATRPGVRGRRRGRK